MKNFGINVQTMLMKIGTWIEWFIGGYDGLFCALFVFVIINFITNIMRGILDRQWHSCFR